LKTIVNSLHLAITHEYINTTHSVRDIVDSADGETMSVYSKCRYVSV